LKRKSGCACVTNVSALRAKATDKPGSKRAAKTCDGFLVDMPRAEVMRCAFLLKLCW